MTQIGDYGSISIAGMQRSLYPSDLLGNLDLILKGYPWSPPEEQADFQQDDFDGYFTLRDMKRFVGMDIKWTSNLLQHLYLACEKESGRRRTLFVFHNATVLEELLHRYGY